MEKKVFHLNTQSNVNEMSSFTLELDSEWLNTEEAAAFLKISVKTLRNKSSNGTIPFHKFSRLNRYKKSELAQLIRPAFEKKEVPNGS